MSDPEKPASLTPPLSNDQKKKGFGNINLSGQQ
jgi:hypothetical protein